MHPITTLFSNRSDRAFWTRLLYNYILASGYYRIKPNDAIDVMGRDWDTLIILDACRFDTFVDTIPDDWPDPKLVKSRSGNTWDFYSENFQDAPYPDTVVVTANPRTVRLQGESFHDIVPVYKDDWDNERGTVMPEVMARRTISAHKEYPNKRILSHWIQPHYPFIGSDKLEGYRFEGEPVWYDLMRGDIDSDIVYQAYQDTLNDTIPHVQEVIESISGKVVVSSDHGNAFGERPWWFPIPIYGHPRGIRHWSVINVPWMEVTSGYRRKITSGSASKVESDQPEVEEKLAALGYK